MMNLLFLLAGCGFLVNDSAEALSLKRQPASEVLSLIDAAEKGNPEAQTSLGFCYYAGAYPVKGVDHDKAFYWTNRAVETYKKSLTPAGPEKAVAYNNLGFFYKAGIGCDKNPQEALALLKQAAEWTESSTPFFNLAAMYYAGRGVEASERDAYAYFSQALEKSPQMLNFFDLCSLLEQEKDPKISAFFIKMHSQKSQEVRVKEAFTLFKKVLHKGEKAENAFLQLLAGIRGRIYVLEEKGDDPTSRKALEKLFSEAKELVSGLK